MEQSEKVRKQHKIKKDNGYTATGEERIAGARKRTGARKKRPYHQ